MLYSILILVFEALSIYSLRDDYFLHYQYRELKQYLNDVYSNQAVIYKILENEDTIYIKINPDTTIEQCIDITEYINDNYDEEYIVDFVAFDAQDTVIPHIYSVVVFNSNDTSLWTINNSERYSNYYNFLE